MSLVRGYLPLGSYLLVEWKTHYRRLSEWRNFLDFVRRNLLLILLPFDGDNPRSSVVMDNASIHHIQEVTDLNTATEALIRFLPPYSPDLNPIELAFNKVKAFLKANDTIFQATHAPCVLVGSAFSTITQEDCACRIYTSLWIRVTCYAQFYHYLYHVALFLRCMGTRSQQHM